jgi:glycosyltransferase involved in cell wall biosynthesis
MVTELLSEPFDEGMKIFSLKLADYLHRNTEALVITNAPEPPQTPPVMRLSFGKAMASRSLWRRLRSFRPGIVVYVPQASLTPSTFLRLVALRVMSPGATLGVIGLQPRQLRGWTRALLPLLTSLKVFTQSRTAAGDLSRFGFDAASIRSGVDFAKFRTVTPDVKKALRERFDLDPGAFTILHVGHLAPSRNLDVLVELAKDGRNQVVMVASTSTTQDPAIKDRLTGAGVRVIDRAVPKIEELYQLSDAYLFPVLNPGGAIEMPLSVFEAMACGVPVLTTPFGDLERVIPATPAVIFWRTDAELRQGVETVRQTPGLGGDLQQAVAGFGWDDAFSGLLRTLENA